ncbi:MAG: hypothetical protein AAF401_12560 [Pseudomonadota bacterium]
MVMAVMILGTLLIGVFVPRMAVARMPSGLGVMVGCAAALALGAGFIWISAAAFNAIGVEETKSAFDRGFNAWKVMIFVAPAVALHMRRGQMKEG